MKALLLVGIGGFVGSVARYYTHLFFHKLLPGNYPLGTFTVNIAGCFVLGILFGLGMKQEAISNEWRLLIAVGFCGGFTTFSTFSLENIILIQSGNIMIMAAYFFTTVIVGFGATLLGIYLFK